MEAKPSRRPVGLDAIDAAADEIRSMRVRGAAKIGRHAVAALAAFAEGWDGDVSELDAAAARLVDARPTAVALPNAVGYVASRARRAAANERPAALRSAAAEFDALAHRALSEIGRHGAKLVEDGATVLTICNSQGALAPLFHAAKEGRRFEVVALETRPWRQGLLTVRQLHDAGISAALAVDSAAWSLLPTCDIVLTGADTIAQNGDVVNKVGTGGLAVLASERQVPLYVCAETFKLDLRSATGEDVVIEERESAEIVSEGEIPAEVKVRNPVFDVTPRRYVRGYVTDAGLLRADEVLAAARERWLV